MRLSSLFLLSVVYLMGSHHSKWWGKEIYVTKQKEDLCLFAPVNKDACSVTKAKSATMVVAGHIDIWRCQGLIFCAVCIMLKQIKCREDERIFSLER